MARINLNNVLRGPGNSDDVEVNANLVLPLGKGQVMAVEATISAAGSTTADATVVNGPVIRATTVGSGAGIRFPSAAAGRVFHVVNTGANALLVYPNTGGRINYVGVDVGFSMASAAKAMFIATATDNFMAVASA